MVSGVPFELDSLHLESHTEHKLYTMCADARKNGEKLEFVVDRPSDSFGAILAFYQTGQLHMPNNVCPGAFRCELEYWGIPDSNLQQCCYYRYVDSVNCYFW